MKRRDFIKSGLLLAPMLATPAFGMKRALMVSNYPNEARAIVAALSATPTSVRGAAIARAVRSLKSAGIWQKIAVMQDFCPAAAADFGIDWKTPTRAKPVFMGSPTSGTGTSVNQRLNRHFKGDAAAIYAKTGVLPNAIGLSETNFCEWEWSNHGIPNVGTGGSNGVRSPAGTRCSIDLTPGSLAGWVNDSTAAQLTGTGGIVSVQGVFGLVALEHSAAGTRNAYARGTAIVTGNTATTALTPCTAEAYVGCVNNLGATLSLHAHPTSFYGYSQALTAAQHAQFYTIMSRYMSDIGNWSPPIVTWSDSIALHPTLNTGYPGQIAAASDPWRDWSNQAVAGETTTQILTRMQASASNFTNYVHVIGGGYNDMAGIRTAPGTAAAVISTALANVAAMVALASGTSGRYIILAPYNGDSNDVARGGPGDTSEYSGGTVYNAMLTYIAALQAAYPGKVVDSRAAMIAASSGSGQDAIDVGNGITPLSQREDFIHPGTNGATGTNGPITLSTAIRTVLTANGY